MKKKFFYSNFWKRINVNWSFNWFFHEREVSLKSGLCLFVYFFLLLSCVYLYYLCSKVPTREFNVRAEEIKTNWEYKYTNGIYSVPRLNLTFNIPMTMQDDTLTHKDNGMLIYSTSHETKNDSVFISLLDKYYFYSRYKPQELESFVNENSYELFSYNEEIKKRKYDFFKELPNVLQEINSETCIEDSLKNNVFLIDFTQKTDERISPLYTFSPRKSLIESDKGKSILELSGTPECLRSLNIYCLNSQVLSARNTQNSGALYTPSWLNLSDISQGYYCINLSSATFDDISLTFDFCGISQFSALYPVPDDVRMSSITYNDKEKIEIIKNNGLKFHVTFPEMQNKQKVREFALSGAISVLLTLILNDLLLLGLSKLGRKKEEK